MISIMLLAALVSTAPLLAVGKDAAMYIAGSITEIPANVEGRLELRGEDKMVFAWKGGAWELAYKRVRALRYGQEARHRTIENIAITWAGPYHKK